MKKYLILLLLYPFLFFGQDDSFNFEQNVTGVITTSEGTYLILEQGFIKMPQTDMYTEYYRQIYNDSTLTNPNTELKSEFGLDIIPYIITDSHQKRIDFTEPLKIGIFVKLNESGKLNFTSDFREIIDSLSCP
jgi:hypothetical protein